MHHSQNAATLKSSRLTALLVATTLLLGGCVTTNNSCGNEERDWNNLHFPKNRYCSVPAFLPFSDYYEAANKAVCKVHDNNSGKRSSMKRSEADKRFLCDYMKHSELPTGLRTATAYMSYLLLRVAAPLDAGIKADSLGLQDRENKVIRDNKGQAIQSLRYPAR